MRIFKSAKRIQNHIIALKRSGKKIGFVPTMGYLHKGHLSLIRQARRDNSVVVLSIFVNPAQFGPSEDYERYPRNLKMDLKLARDERVDIVYYPADREMYPENYYTYVNVEVLSDVLCGKFRPGHFKGVATVCTKLFNIIQPDVVYMGQKDAQQAMIIKQMVKDLNMPLKIKILPIIREQDGLAMSSRNEYLSKDEKKQALVIYQALRIAESLFKEGVKNAGKIKSKVKNIILKMPKIKIEYVEIVDLKSLNPIVEIKEPVLLAVAVWINGVRLIDNIILKP